MVIFAFIVGGLYGSLMMTLLAAEAYRKGFKAGAKWDE